MLRITPLLKFVFSYEKFQCRIPIIPVHFISIDNKLTPIFHAVLDSGADTLTIPKDLAEWLGVKLQPKVTPTVTASGSAKAYTGIVPLFILGQGGREVKYQDVEICAMENCPYILVGISPVFEDYQVIINARNRKFILEPIK